jgi:epoxyqueuosine reductase
MLSRTQVTQMALNLGFDLVGFAPAGPTPGAQAFLDWLSAGFHGEMHYLTREPAKRLDPQLVLPGVRTVMMVGASYDTLSVPPDVLHDPSRGRIARYAWGADYHDVLTPRLRELGEQLAQVSRAYVDTGPVLERAWAQAAGLGFIGRNTCLINWSRGSFLFLGAVLLGEEIDDEHLEMRDQRLEIARSDSSSVIRHSSNAQSPVSNPQSPLANQQSKIQNLKSPCGGCTRCLNACPTQAFRGPGVLDARRCISYLTIELKGAIPVELRPHMGNWLFGCDVCQDVCPYVRRFSSPTHFAAFYPHDVDRAAPPLMDLLSLDRPAFNARFKGTPLLRAKRRGVLRNACIAAGNWGSPQALPPLEQLLHDEEQLLHEHAAWAIARIAAKQMEAGS